MIFNILVVKDRWGFTCWISLSLQFGYALVVASHLVPEYGRWRRAIEAQCITYLSGSLQKRISNCGVDYRTIDGSLSRENYFHKNEVERLFYTQHALHNIYPATSRVNALLFYCVSHKMAAILFQLKLNVCFYETFWKARHLFVHLKWREIVQFRSRCEYE